MTLIMWLGTLLITTFSLTALNGWIGPQAEPPPVFGEKVAEGNVIEFIVPHTGVVQLESWDNDPKCDELGHIFYINDVPQLVPASTGPCEDPVDKLYSYALFDVKPGDIVKGDTQDDSGNLVIRFAAALTAEKTAFTGFTRTYTWTIDKNVTPDAHSGFAGESFSSDYDVILDRSEVDSGFVVTGTITVSNPNPIAVDFAVSDSVGGTAATVNCPTTSLAANTSTICTYSAALGDTKPANGTNTATITSNTAGVQGTTASAPYTFGSPTTTVGYATVNVTDTVQGTLGSTWSDFTFEYKDDFACPTDASLYTNGVHTFQVPNTATIVETGQSADADVTVTCYAPVVTKDATASYDETHIWSIVKTVNPASQSGIVGDVLPWTWTVDVSETPTDDNFAVSGTIYVTNPSPDEPMTVNVADTLDDGTTATVDCGSGSTSLTVAAGATGTCTYSASPTGKAATLNTATATLNGAGFSGTATVTFVKNVIGGTATVTDDEIGLDESLTAGEGPWTRTGDDSHTCSTNPDDYGTDGSYSGSVPNTATVVASNEQTDSDDATTAYTCYIQTPELAGLGDLVWNDTNQNGVQDAGEVGVPNVTVNLLDTGGNVLDTTTTDANGLYSFINLTPGSYVVEFVKPAGTVFSPQNQGGDPAKDSNADTTTGKSGIVTLVGGQFDGTIDAGIFTPAPPPELAGLGNLVWNDTNQNGVQDAGELGVPNVTVNLLDTVGNVLDTTTTDANGLYTFINLTPGSYVVEFVKPAGTLFSPQNQGVDDAIDSDADTTTGKSGIVTLVGGQFDDTIDAGISTPTTPPVSTGLGNRVWYDTNANGVQDAGELSVPNFTVNLLDTGGNVLATTKTDANGIYTFTNLAPGNYVVEFVKLDSIVFSPQNQGGDPAKDGDADTTTGKSGTVTLLAGQFDDTIDAGISTPAPPPELASLGDRVWLDTNKNGLQDQGETGVPGVLVTLFSGSGTELATDTTDANGNYLFEDLDPGSYYVLFAKPQGFVFTQYNVGADDTKDSDAKVPALKLNLSTPAGEVKLGDKLQFTLSYSNTDSLLAAAKVLSTTVPAGTTFLPLESPGWVCEGNQTSAGTRCTFSVAQLAPGAQAQTFFVVQLGTDDVKVPNAINLAVSISQETPAQTEPVTLVGGDQNLTLDAGIYPLGVTTINTLRRPGPTNLEEGNQPRDQVRIFLPAVQN